MDKKENLAGRNIIIVDDEAMVARFLSELLKSQGCNVETILSSTDALEYFRSHHKEIDLVITDQTMPDMTGAELAKAMLVISADVKIFLTTGYSEEINEEQALNIGITAFLKKPIKSSVLIETTSDVLRNT